MASKYPLTVRGLAAHAEGVEESEIRWNTPEIAAAYSFCQNPNNGVVKAANPAGVMIFQVTQEQAKVYKERRQAFYERKAAREAEAQAEATTATKGKSAAKGKAA